MAQLTVNAAPGRAGYSIASAAVAVDVGLTDKFVNDGNTHVIVDNGNAGTLTVTINFPASVTVDGAVPPNKTVTLTTGTFTVLGPFPTSQYNDATGNVSLTWSVAASVKVLVYKAS